MDGDNVEPSGEKSSDLVGGERRNGITSGGSGGVSSVPEFRVNDYITLRLEDGRTRIYICGERFMHCRFLLIVNPHLKEGQSEINSIDEAAELLVDDLERDFTRDDFGITPEQEFWAHCSNLQVWCEHGYDPRLLHSSLSIPLLKRLGESGDKRAFSLYKSVVAERYVSAPEHLRDFYRREGFLDGLTKEEFDSIHLEVYGDEYAAILELESLIGRRIPQVYSIGTISFETQGNTIYMLTLVDCDLPDFPEAIFRLKNLRELRINYCGLRELPERIKELKQLKVLELRNNCLERLPEAISELNNLYWLALSNNQLKHVHELKKGLNQLSTLQLGGNPIEIKELIDLIMTRGYPQRLVSLYGTVEKLDDGTIHIKRRIRRDTNTQ
ncbi:MAG: leucine-rich repeat domain-containing protein [Promethearchaeota archaeon]